ncbi:MAG: transposase [Bryobacteraceae bacterium]|nr:transposase [Bryobacteraceae bacterium]
MESVLSCRTPRRGGHRYHCPECARMHYQFHSCNHRSCPQCGGAQQQRWSASQEAKLLPVPYYLITVTVPEPLRRHCLGHPKELYELLLSQSAQGVRELCENPKHLAGQPGFTAVLQTWTRRILHHPHVHILIPAVGLTADGCSAVHPKNEEFLIPVIPLAARIRNLFKQQLAHQHPDLHEHIDPVVWEQNWVVDCRPAGSGRTALRYLAGYVCKAAFKEDRLVGCDPQGRILLRWKDSDDHQWKTESLEPLELLRRWLLHVLPKGFVAVRHFGFLSPAAGRALRRIRFLLGRGPVIKPTFHSGPRLCLCCQRPMILAARILPVRGPPLSRNLFTFAA